VKESAAWRLVRLEGSTEYDAAVVSDSCEEYTELFASLLNDIRRLLGSPVDAKA
jgi:hypothetical protein